MYTGHIGLALGVKGFQQQVSLWLLCVAALMPDLVDFSAQLFRADTSQWTHTLPGMVGAAMIFFAVGWLLTRSWTAAAATGLLACSHVSADLLTSRLELWPNGPTAGLHWYRHPVLDFSVEAVVVLIGWVLYGRFSPSKKASINGIARDARRTACASGLHGNSERIVTEESASSSDSISTGKSLQRGGESCLPQSCRRIGEGLLAAAVKMRC